MGKTISFGITRQSASPAGSAGAEGTAYMVLWNQSSEQRPQVSDWPPKPIASQLGDLIKTALLKMQTRPENIQ